MCLICEPNVPNSLSALRCLPQKNTNRLYKKEETSNQTVGNLFRMKELFIDVAGIFRRSITNVMFIHRTIQMKIRNCTKVNHMKIFTIGEIEKNNQKILLPVFVEHIMKYFIPLNKMRTMHFY